MYITKNKRLDGFTLIELLITISITSVLLIFISQWIIAVPFKTINQVTRDISLQSGVTATGDMVSDIIKKSTQVHLIGSNVFEPSLNLKGKDKTKLDNNYSYIAIKKDTFGNKLLYNITPNNDANGNIINWIEEPIMATNKKSLLKNGQIFSYDLDFYKDDNNYLDKFNNKILSITITGQAYKDNKISDDNKYGKEVVYKKDIELSNANQILFSKFLNGSMNDISAIAYVSSPITQKTEIRKSSGKMAFIMAYDNSYSMTYSTTGEEFLRAGTMLKSKSTNKKYLQRDLIYNSSLSPRAYIVGRSSDKFINDLYDNAQKSRTDIPSYIFSFSSFVMDYPFVENDSQHFNGKNAMQATPTKYMNPKRVLSKNFDSQYLTKLSDISPYIGPYNLRNKIDKNNAIQYIKDPKQIGMGLSLDNFHINDNDANGKNNLATNTGEAILKAIEIATQLKKEKNYDKVFFVLLSDGNPENATFIADSNNNSNILFLNGAKIAREHKEVLSTERVMESIQNKSAIASSLGRIEQAFTTDDYHKIALLYVKEVTNNAKNEYQTKLGSKKIFDNTFLIGFSAVKSDVDKFNKIGQYLEDISDEVTVLKAGDKISLDITFEKVLESIKTSTDLFSGPRKLS